MDLMQMTYFVRVAESDTMLRAAEELNVSQSTLSMSIKKLETELGTKLFRREGHSLKLTEAGKLFHEGANRILQDTAALRQKLRSVVDERGRTIVIATDAVDYATESIYLFSARYPQTPVEHMRSSTTAMRNLLQTWQADFCLSMQPLTDDNIESILLLSEPMYLLAPADSRYADMNSVSIRDLAGETLVSLHKGQSFRALCDRCFAMSGTRPPRVLEVGELESLSHSVRRRFGVTFIPQSVQGKDSFYRENGGALCTRPMQEPFCYRNIYLSHLKSSSHSPQHEEFLQFLYKFNDFIKANKRFPELSEC